MTHRLGAAYQCVLINLTNIEPGSMSFEFLDQRTLLMTYTLLKVAVDSTGRIKHIELPNQCESIVSEYDMICTGPTAAAMTKGVGAEKLDTAEMMFRIPINVTNKLMNWIHQADHQAGAPAPQETSVPLPASPSGVDGRPAPEEKEQDKEQEQQEEGNYISVLAPSSQNVRPHSSTDLRQRHAYGEQVGDESSHGDDGSFD
jgi:hypothetical protein